ncbi:endopeptidase La [Alphaproteobacteria bacterium]|nr:endopeptidase La [Alphaproteobacteria bacterium]MDC1087054.1 endopeptidase La [Alphaproteobacteria bacterium]
MTETIYPILPLRDIVIFPHMIAPLFVGRLKSINALELVMEENKQIVLLTQKKPSVEDPKQKDLFKVGTLGNILQMLKLPDGTVKVLVEGKSRCIIQKVNSSDEYIDAKIKLLKDEEFTFDNKDILTNKLSSVFEQYAKLNGKINSDILSTISEISDPSTLTDTIVNHLLFNIEEKQEFLEMMNPMERTEKLTLKLETEIEILSTERKIRNRVKKQMEKTQREYYLNEQMKAIQKELGSSEDGKNEFDEIEDKINKGKLSKEAKEKAMSELKKLKSMSPMSAEATVVRSYIDWLTSIPWTKKSKVKTDIENARRILDNDHYGLEKVKDRIVEFLAVQKRTKEIKGPILCLVGPPGVGKTSLGKSIAEATGRQYIRMALGGVRDEAEIRGHRRTYIGSLPGKIIHGMKKGSTINPLFLLDEIDKLGNDYRGDPSSALLEVLDPEQNKTFQDHYLEVDYDLSKVLFVTTSNTLNMPQALLDRMEIIRLSGYTEDEKLQIAKKHLIDKQMENCKLKKSEFSINDDAIKFIIQSYTREAGVRGLERQIAKLTRKIVTLIEKNEVKSFSITKDNLTEILGVPIYQRLEIEKENLVGITTGLAWTEVGGELLSIEAVKVTGKGKVTATGKLGDVMKESVKAAEFLIKSKALDYGLDPIDIEKSDIHVHVPEGATPKDGPSAGVAMVTSIVSALTDIKIKSSVGMTGEITLRGRVLPIGGLKEKLLAAKRGGLKTILIPIDNKKDLVEIPDNIKDELEIIPVSSIDQVVSNALVKMPEKINVLDVSNLPPTNKTNIIDENNISH